MFCTQCGKAITDENPFCTNCGAATQSVSSGTKVPDFVKPIPRRPVFRVGSLREWVNFVLWLFYLFIVGGVHTLYAAFLLMSALLLVGPLHLAWRKKQATSVAKRVFLWVPVPVSALLLAMSAAKMTPYAYSTDRRGAVSVRVDRWSGCSWMRAAGSSEEWGNLDCPNDDHSWLSEFTQSVEQPRESDARSKRASTPTPVSAPEPSVEGPITLEVAAFDPQVPAGANRPNDLVTLTYDPSKNASDPYRLELYVGRAQSGTKSLSVSQWLDYTQQNSREITLYDNYRGRVMFYDELTPTQRNVVQGFCERGLKIYGRGPGVPEGSFGTALPIDFDPSEMVSGCGLNPEQQPLPPLAQRPTVVWLNAVFGFADGHYLGGELLYDSARGRRDISVREASGEDHLVSLADWLATPQDNRPIVVLFNTRGVLPNGSVGHDGLDHPYDTLNTEEKAAAQDFCQRGLFIYSWPNDMARSVQFRFDPSKVLSVCGR